MRQLYYRSQRRRHDHGRALPPPHTHAPPQPVCLPPSQPTFTGRRSDVHYLLFRIAQNTAVAGTGSIVMDANMISLSGGFGQVVFETTAGTFGGADLGCSATRAWRSAGSSVAFTPPADGVFTIRALYASGYGAVSVAAEYVAGDSCLEDRSVPVTASSMSTTCLPCSQPSVRPVVTTAA